MSLYLDDILKKLGWEDGFQIPVANFENQGLEEELARLTLQKIKAKTAFDASNQKLENLDNHLKYVKQESEQNQNLITAHVQQLQSEEDKLRTNIAERDKIDQDIRQFGKQSRDVEERQEIKKQQLQRAAVRLERLRSETNWDEEALKAWDESLQKRDDDNELIKKFSKEDERKYNELEAKRQNLEKEYTSRKQTIEKMVCDITNYERILERTGKVMKQQFIERNALIQQWKDSVKILQQRDNDIDRLQQQIIETEEIVEKELEKLEEQKQFYKNEIRNNDELEHESQQLNFLNSKKRRELNELCQYILLLNSEADTLRRSLLSTANHLEKERNRTKNIRQDIAAKEKRIRGINAALNVLKEKAAQLKEATLSSDEGTNHLERLIDQEQKQQRTLQNDNEIMQNAYFRAQQELFEEQNDGKTLEMKIYGVTTTISHLRKHNEDKRKTLGKQKEDVYELDFKVDELQNKILQTETVVFSDDKAELEAKIEDLEKKIAEYNDVRNLLKDQVNRIQDDMRRLTAAITSDQGQVTLLENKLQDQLLGFEGGQKQVEVSKRQFQEKQVEENILRLRLDHLNKAMKREEKGIYNSQKFRLNLEQATKERLLEIDTNKEILWVKRRNLSEDKGRLRSDIVERRIRLDQFQKKYNIVLMSLGKDEDGQPLSVTHFKIRNAQEKFLLQQEGDQLDLKIKTAEKEIVAMENTLKIVNLTNAAFKQSLGAVEDDGREMGEMKMLETQLLQVNDTLRKNRKELERKRQELKDAQSALDLIEMRRGEEKELLHEIEDNYLAIERERLAKEEKIGRTERCLKIAEKKVSKNTMEKYDRDLEIRQLRDANKAVMHKLVDMSIHYQDIMPLIKRYALEYEIKLPESTTPLRGSTESIKSTRSTLSEKEVSSVRSDKSDSSRSSAISKVVLTFNL